MPSLRRGLAALDMPSPTVPLELRGHGSSTTLTPEQSADPATYATGLNGVDQVTNILFQDMLWWTLGIFALVVLSYRMLEVGWAKLRHVSAMSMSAQRQGYWRRAQWSFVPDFKKNLIYAPLWAKRHNREIRLSSAISVGTLPSRLHFIILSILVISNLIYTFYVDWSNGNRYSLTAEIRGRTGTLSLVNMVPLIILAGRNNPLIPILRISFDTYNLLHRWLGRLVVLEAVAHTVAWAYVQYHAGGWESISEKLRYHTFEASGMIGTAALCVLVILALGPIRHAFYETFLNIHIILAFITFAMVWVHCASSLLAGGLPQLPWMWAIFIMWMLERLARVFRIAYHNWSRRRSTEAVVEAMPGETSRVTLHLPRHVKIRPGSHAYLRFWGVSPWECHPFSIAWVDHQPAGDDLGLERKTSSYAELANGTTTASFIIGAHTGFTRKLYNRALAAPSQQIRLRAAMEGPYAGHHSLDSYGHVVLFAGSTGITHQLSYLKPLIEGYSDETVATRRITLVWVVRDTEAMHWIRPYMDEILRLPGRRDILQVRLFITRPKNSKEMHSPSSTVQMFPGRPNIPTLLRKEVDEQVGAMCVTVCGPGAFADDVRQAVRDVQDDKSVVDFVEESFTW